MENLFLPKTIEEEKTAMALNNSELLGRPAFIMYDIKLADDHDLTTYETLLFGYTHFFLKNNPGKQFYFTSPWLAKLLRCSEWTITQSFKKLTGKGLIKLGHKPKSGGGLIRFIEIPSLEIHSSELGNSQGIDTKTNRDKEKYIKESYPQRGDNSNLRIYGTEKVGAILQRKNKKYEKSI